MRFWDLVLHLRLHWQVMLAPLFLWGFVLAAGDNARNLITLEFWLVFFIFHVMFYGGATALNSYYDQDEGDPPDRLARAIAEANTVIYAEGQEQDPPVIMATTVVVAVLRGRLEAKHGLDVIDRRKMGEYAVFRGVELAAALNRLPTLRTK